MLSGETAYGKYPVESGEDDDQDCRPSGERASCLTTISVFRWTSPGNDVTAFLAKQAVKATTKLKIRAIITDSYSGRTARNLAAFPWQISGIGHLLQGKDHAAPCPFLRCGSYLYARTCQRAGILFCSLASLVEGRPFMSYGHGGLPE